MDCHYCLCIVVLIIYLVMVTGGLSLSSFCLRVSPLFSCLSHFVFLFLESLAAMDDVPDLMVAKKAQLLRITPCQAFNQGACQAEDCKYSHLSDSFSLGSG
jgi:hypothetical protein